MARLDVFINDALICWLDILEMQEEEDEVEALVEKDVILKNSEGYTYCKLNEDTGKVLEVYETFDTEKEVKEGVRRINEEIRRNR